MRGESSNELFVAVTDDDDAILAQAVLHLHDLAGAIGLEDFDHVHRLVEDDLDATTELRSLELRSDADAHLAAGREDVHGAVLVR